MCAQSNHALDGVHTDPTWQIQWINLCDGCNAALCYHCCSNVLILQKLLKLQNVKTFTAQCHNVKGNRHVNINLKTRTNPLVAS